MLRVPLRAIDARIAADLAAAGYGDLRPAHFVVFQYLPAEGAHASDLAALARVTKQSMGYLLDALEAGSYVERAPDPTDHRARIVRRTARGWAVERVARASLQRLEAEWGARLGTERMREFRAILAELARLLEP